MDRVQFPQIDSRFKTLGDALINQIPNVLSKDSGVPDIENSAEIKNIENNIK